MQTYAEFLRREDCILLVVDVQKVLLDPCVEADQVRENAAALIDVAKLLGMPVLFSVQNVDKLGGVVPDLTERLLEPRILNKLEFSCFENAVIAGSVRETGRRTILLVGIESHICIFQTGAHALRLGYRLHVATDAVSARSALNHQMGLNRLEKAGAVISSTEMIIYELLNRTGTKEFRDALPILKKL